MMFKIIYLFILSVFIYSYALAKKYPLGSVYDQSSKYGIKESYSKKCTLGDGYLCVEYGKYNDLAKRKVGPAIPGAYMRAWIVAYNDFLMTFNLEPEIKRFEHYRYRFDEDDKHYIVNFGALALPMIVDGKIVMKKSLLSIGHSVTYWINKDDYTITKKLSPK